MKKFYLFIVPVLLTFLITSCSKTVSTSPPDPIPTDHANIFVNSKPDNAAIYINGKNSGNRTPDTVKWLEPGTYKVTLKLPLYKDSNVVATAKEYETTSLFLDFTTNRNMMGGLYCNTVPAGANIYLNDSLTELITPASIDNLLPGSYTVTYTKKGFWNATVSGMVKSNSYEYLPDAFLADTSLWIHYNTSHTPIPTNYLNFVTVEKGYIKWAGTSEDGAIRFDDKNWSSFTTDNSRLPSNKVNSIYIDSLDRKWFCTANGLAMYDDNSWTIYNTSNSSLPSDEVKCMVFDPTQNSIWIGTNNGLVRVKDDEWTIYDESNSKLPYSNIYALAVDNDGNKWVGTIGAGLIQFNSPRTMQVFSTGGLFEAGADPKTTAITSIAVDGNGWVWASIGSVGLGGASGGCCYYRKDKFILSQHYPSNSVMSVTVDRRNKKNVKWFGNLESGLARYEDRWEYFNTGNSGIGSDRIFSVATDGAGNVWMASYGNGLIKYKGR